METLNENAEDCDSEVCVKKSKISILSKRNIMENCRKRKEAPVNILSCGARIKNEIFLVDNFNKQEVNLQKNPSDVCQVTLIYRSEGILIDKEISTNPLNTSLTTGSPYNCILFCEKSYYNNAKLKIHYVLTHGLNYCKLCDLILKDADEKEKHAKNSHCRKICEICQESVENVEKINDHYSEAHDALVCQFCEILLYPRCFYEEHILKKHNATERFVANKSFDHLVDAIEKQTFSCNVCDKIRDKEMIGHFISYHKVNVYNFIETLRKQNLEKEALMAMEYSHQNEEEDLRQKCKVCKQIVLNAQSIGLHQAYCESKSVCNFCTKIFDSIEDLDTHVFEEHNKFCCELGCDNLAYNNYDNLKKHYGNHHSKIMCIYCNDAISSDSNTVKKHFREFHLYSSKKTLLFLEWLLENNNDAGSGRVVTCTLCELDLRSYLKDVNNLLDHFKEFHKVSMDQILKLIGPNPQVFTYNKESVKEEEVEDVDSGSDDNADDESAQLLKLKNYDYQHRVMSDFIKCIYDVKLLVTDQMEAKCDLCILTLDSNVDLLEHIQEKHDFDMKTELSSCKMCAEGAPEQELNFRKHLEHSILKKELIPCSKCEALVSDCEDDMRQHILQQHPGELEEFPMETFAVKCRFCHKTFWEEEECNDHEKSTHYEQNRDEFLVCFTCNTVFRNQKSLSQHVNTQCNRKFGSVSFICKSCKFVYPNSFLLKAHLLNHHDKDILIVCPLCGKLYGKKKYVLQHIRNVHLSKDEAVKSYDCPTCGKKFKSGKSVKLHKNQSHGRGFKCRICDEKFLTFENRKLHYSQVHPRQFLYECKLCGKMFFSKSGLHRHTKIHDQRMNKCEYCGKEFMSKDSYKEHVLIHIGPKHQCPYCPKAFTQKSNLRRHIRLHTGVKPYSCPFCPKKFSDKGACKSHTRVHTREEDCNCLVCGKRFSTIQKLKYHMKLHTGEGLLDCDQCGKKFTTTYRLRDHRALHERGTKYMCECGKSFTKESNLKRHVSDVHDKEMKTKVIAKSYKCLLCHNWYVVRSSANKHLKRIHDVAKQDFKKYILNTKPKKRSKASKLKELTSTEVMDHCAEEDEGSSHPEDDKSEDDAGQSVEHGESILPHKLEKDLLENVPFQIQNTIKRETDNSYDQDNSNDTHFFFNASAEKSIMASNYTNGIDISQATFQEFLHPLNLTRADVKQNNPVKYKITE